MPMKRHEKNVVLFLLRHLAYGVVGGVVFGGLVLYYDIGHMRSLALDSDNGLLTLGVFFFGLLITFGSLGMAAGVMGLAQDDN
jgi:hypothetical protein